MAALVGRGSGALLPLDWPQGFEMHQVRQETELPSSPLVFVFWGFFLLGSTSPSPIAWDPTIPNLDVLSRQFQNEETNTGSESILLESCRITMVTWEIEEKWREPLRVNHVVAPVLWTVCSFCPPYGQSYYSGFTPSNLPAILEPCTPTLLDRMLKVFKKINTVLLTKKTTLDNKCVEVW